MLLQLVSIRDKVLRDRAEELPPTEPVDIMIGRANVRLSLFAFLPLRHPLRIACRAYADLARAVPVLHRDPR